MSLNAVEQKKFIAKVVKLLEECLTCNKVLEKKNVVQGKLRCKKCSKSYADVWPATHKLFLDMFGKKNV